MQKWQYQSFSLTIDRGMFGQKSYDIELLDTELNRLGEDGWQLVTITELNTNGWTGQLIVTLRKPR